METGKTFRGLLGDLHSSLMSWGAVAAALGMSERNVRLLNGRTDDELAAVWPKYRDKAYAAAREAGIEPMLYDDQVVLWDPRLSFERNLSLVIDAPPIPVRPFRSLSAPFLGFVLNSPFGSPASVITATADRIQFLARTGCDLITYKTVRSRATHSHPTPNILLALERVNRLEPDQPIPPILVADSLECDEWISAARGMLNRYGMPSQPPSVWQADIQRSLSCLSAGQQLIVSIAGTVDVGAGPDALIADYARVALMAHEAGARILEANLSCPNAGTEGEVYRDTDVAERVCIAIRNAVPELPLIAKIGYLPTQQLENLVLRIAPHIQGVAAINTIPEQGLREGVGGRVPAFFVQDLKAGLSGGPIHGFAMKCVGDLAEIRKKHELNDLVIIGIGGVAAPSEVFGLLRLGANAVQAATAFYEDAYFGLRVRRYLEEQYLSSKRSLDEQLREEHWNWSEAVRLTDGLRYNKPGLALAHDVWFEHEATIRETASRGPRKPLPIKSVQQFTRMIAERLR